eukprot:195514-Chlamydomonas_euryale.AAC.3
MAGTWRMHGRRRRGCPTQHPSSRKALYPCCPAAATATLAFQDATTSNLVPSDHCKEHPSPPHHSHNSPTLTCGVTGTLPHGQALARRRRRRCGRRLSAAAITRRAFCTTFRRAWKVLTLRSEVWTRPTTSRKATRRARRCGVDGTPTMAC